MLLAMATTILGKRVLEIRRANGMGEKGQAASFARLIGITPASLHNLESGESESLGRSLPGLLFKAHANPSFLLHGKGPPVLKDIERSLRAQTLVSMMLELEESEVDTIERIVQTYIRAKPGSSRNDPFKQNPPKRDDD